MKKRKFDYRYIICIAITLIIGVGFGYMFRGCFIRLWESIKDFCLCIAFFFCNIFEIESNFSISINEFSSALPFVKLPSNFEGYKNSFLTYWQKFFDNRVFFDYLKRTILNLKSVVFVLTIGLLLFLIILIFKVIFGNITNNNYSEETKALKIFKKFGIFVRKIKLWIVDLFNFCKENKFFIIWTFEFAIIFNLATIIIEFIAFYFYFLSTWNISDILIQISKLIIDLTPIFKSVPIPIWILIVLLIFNYIRKNIGYKILNHNERKNRGYINERPIVTMNCGIMGKGKTTLSVDMALSQEVMFRKKALDIMIELDIMFPNFPWINLENSLKRLIDKHVIYNLATIDEFFKVLKRNFKKPTEDIISYYKDILGEFYFENLIFGYDYSRYGLKYNNELKVYHIFEILREYAKAYFVYVVQSVYLISNLSVRNDDYIKDIGNLPIWKNDFFKRSPNVPSRFAHIIDYDAFRLGRKLIEENEKSNFFEFGIVLITEIGKERGNNLENREVKKNDFATNQKNDRFNDFLKMIRHSAMIWNYCFVKVITDEQRPESWGADARNLCEVVRIKDVSERKLAIPFFMLENTIFEVLRPKFDEWYCDFRYRRGDYSLPFYIKKNLLATFFNWYIRKINTFGYYKMKVQIEDGAGLDKPKKNYYYIAFKKIYANRFRSDCFCDYFYNKSRSSGIGLDEVPEFDTVLAKISEMKLMNSYFYEMLDFVNRQYSNPKNN